jgi:hypothetical protein
VSEYDNELRGVLFKNKQKRPDKKDADYRGNATINGVEFWLDAWINEPKSGGDKFMSIKFKAKDVQPQAAVTPAASTPQPEFDDPIPF